MFNIKRAFLKINFLILTVMEFQIQNFEIYNKGFLFYSTRNLNVFMTELFSITWTGDIKNFQQHPLKKSKAVD